LLFLGRVVDQGNLRVILVGVCAPALGTMYCTDWAPACYSYSLKFRPFLPAPACYSYSYSYSYSLQFRPLLPARTPPRVEQHHEPLRRRDDGEEHRRACAVRRVLSRPGRHRRPCVAPHGAQVRRPQ